MAVPMPGLQVDAPWVDVDGCSFRIFQGPDDPDFLSAPHALSVDNERIIVSDTLNHRVLVFNRIDGAHVATIGGTRGSEPGQFNEPHGVGSMDGGRIVVADCRNGRVQIFNSDGVLEAIIGEDELHEPKGVAVDGEHVIVADSKNHRVLTFTLQGALVGCVGTGHEGEGPEEFKYPCAVAVGSDGRLMVVDQFNHRVQVFHSCQGELDLTIGTGYYASDDGSFNQPACVAVDQEGNIYVCEEGNHRVQVFCSDGVHKRTIGGTQDCGVGEFDSPSGVAVDPAAEFVVVADTWNNRLHAAKLA